MKDPRRNLNRIPKENLTAYERWELPLLDAKGNEVAREEELNVKPLTAANIEEIRQAAYADGLEEGRKEGFEAGHEEGLKTGHDEGFASGEQRGGNRAQKRASKKPAKTLKPSLSALST